MAIIYSASCVNFEIDIGVRMELTLLGSGHQKPA
jgi:hypothetical protein